MRVSKVKSTWIKEDGTRLDCTPYTAGGLVDWHRLKDSDMDKVNLGELLHPGKKGNYKGKLLQRVYSCHKPTSVPYLTTTGMLLKHYDFIPRLANRVAEKDPECFVKSRDILVSAAGTIGNLVMVNPQMEGFFTSSDNIRIRVNDSVISPFYVFAFLSSKYGKIQIENGSYGSIIRHLSTDHMGRLIIPRLGEKEIEISNLMESAFLSRSEANRLIIESADALRAASHFESKDRISGQIPFGIQSVSSLAVRKRMDARFHSPLHVNAISEVTGRPLRDFCVKVFEPKRFKRNEAENGVDFYGTGAMMRANPSPLYKIKSREAEDYLINEKTLLIPRSGQLSGIVGHVVLPAGKLMRAAISEDAIRVVCNSEEEAAYLFICLRSENVRRQLKSRTFGSSIPHLDVSNIESVVLPEVGPDTRTDIVECVLKSRRLYEQAEKKENQALLRLESLLDKDL